MKILGIDTTTKFLALGIYDGTSPVRNIKHIAANEIVSNGARVYEYSLEVGRRLSVLLVPTIKRVLDALGWQLPDIDYFACGLGPGSFTGVRVGLATIKGMSWAINKPLIGISTLDILARNVRYTDSQIIPIIDAKRSLIYCSIFKNRNGRLNRIKPYMLSSEKELFRNIKANAMIFGDAVDLYKEKILMNIKGATILDKDYWYPKARNIITLAQERIKDKKIDRPFDVKPIYLYPKECQIKH